MAKRNLYLILIFLIFWIILTSFSNTEKLSGIGVVKPIYTMQAYQNPGFYTGRYGTIDEIDLSRKYDESPMFNFFIKWAEKNNIEYEIINERELKNGIPYKLLIFAGHNEYVTKEEVGAVTRYLGRGGRLLFLSANNFYAEVKDENDVMKLQWNKYSKDRGSSLLRNRFLHESELLGNEYNTYYLPYEEYSVPYVVQKADHWIFKGTGLKNGDEFGNTGHETDTKTRYSPINTEILAYSSIDPKQLCFQEVAQNPDSVLYTYCTGSNKSNNDGIHLADMTFYETKKGGWVFATGTNNWNEQLEDDILSRITKNTIVKGLE